jgi:hypothetical protein
LTYLFLEEIQPLDVLRGHVGAVSGFARYQRGRGEIEKAITSSTPNKLIYRKPHPRNRAQE